MVKGLLYIAQPGLLIKGHLGGKDERGHHSVLPRSSCEQFAQDVQTKALQDDKRQHETSVIHVECLAH